MILLCNVWGVESFGGEVELSEGGASPAAPPPPSPLDETLAAVSYEVHNPELQFLLQ